MTVCGRDAGRGRLAVRTEGLAIDVDLCVVEARPPAQQHLLERRLVDAEVVGDRLEVGRQRDDQTDVQILVWPAVEPLADTGREGVVDGRMAEGAGDPDRAQ